MIIFGFGDLLFLLLITEDELFIVVYLPVGLRPASIFADDVIELLKVFIFDNGGFL